MLKKKQGFTLIELLVVIAIIGILASVVLASLNTARIKGKDANIQGTLNGIRAQAELFYDDNSNSYGTTTRSAACGTVATGIGADATIAGQIDGILAQAAAGEDVFCNSGPAFYVIAAPLNEGTDQFWCVDSTGDSKQITIAAPAGVGDNDKTCDLVCD